MTRDDKKQSLKKWNKIQPRQRGKINDIETSRFPHHGESKPRSKAWNSTNNESDEDSGENAEGLESDADNDQYDDFSEVDDE